MKKLTKALDFFNSLDKQSRKEFLSKVGITEGHFRKACCIGSKFGAERCRDIEDASNGAISRFDLRPDAKDIWR